MEIKCKICILCKLSEKPQVEHLVERLTLELKKYRSFDLSQQNHNVIVECLVKQIRIELNDIVSCVSGLDLF